MMEIQIYVVMDGERVEAAFSLYADADAYVRKFNFDRGIVQKAILYGNDDAIPVESDNWNNELLGWL